MIDEIIARIRAFIKRLRKTDCTESIIGGLTKTVSQLDTLTTEKTIEAGRMNDIARAARQSEEAALREAERADRVARNIHNLLNG